MSHISSTPSSVLIAQGVGELCERTATLLTETAQRNVHDRWVKPAWQVI